MPQKITMITRPLAGFEIPSSEGHQLYSAIFGIIPRPRPLTSTISLCPLQGRFKRCLSPRRKELDPEERYGLAVGITDQRESGDLPLRSCPARLQGEEPEAQERRAAGGRAGQQYGQL